MTTTAGGSLLPTAAKGFRRPLTSDDLLKWRDGYGWYTNFAFESLRAVFVVYIALTQPSRSERAAAVPELTPIRAIKLNGRWRLRGGRNGYLLEIPRRPAGLSDDQDEEGRRGRVPAHGHSQLRGSYRGPARPHNFQVTQKQRQRREPRLG